MISQVTNHYEKHLGPVYGWMLGDRSEGHKNARKELEEIGIAEHAPGCAIDLGAGNGLYAIPLAELGFSVLAIDSCKVLIEELARNTRGDSIRTIEGNLLSFRDWQTEPANAILCMGDTLTHLPGRREVEQLFHDIREALAPGGVFVATFRDYVTTELEGISRFIPVRSDEERIFTCFLEYQGETVMVHDLIHTRNTSGWKTTVSAYPKLRLDPHRVEQTLAQTGLRVVLEAGPRGMVRLIGRS